MLAKLDWSEVNARRGFIPLKETHGRYLVVMDYPVLWGIFLGINQRIPAEKLQQGNLLCSLGSYRGVQQTDSIALPKIFAKTLWVPSWGTYIPECRINQKSRKERIINKCRNCLEYCSDFRCYKCGRLQTDLLDEHFGKDKWLAIVSEAHDLSKGRGWERLLYGRMIGGTGGDIKIRQKKCCHCKTWHGIEKECTSCAADTYTHYRSRPSEDEPDSNINPGVNLLWGIPLNNSWIEGSDPRSYGLNLNNISRINVNIIEPEGYEVPIRGSEDTEVSGDDDDWDNDYDEEYDGEEDE